MEGVDDYWRLRPLWEVNVSPDVGVDGAAGVDVDVVDGYCYRNLGGGGCVSCCCYCYCYCCCCC